MKKEQFSTQKPEIIGEEKCRQYAVLVPLIDIDGVFEKRSSQLRHQPGHNIQTDLIQREIRGEHVHVMLIMVHAQDHLMNAIVVKELAQEIIDLHQKIN